MNYSEGIGRYARLLAPGEGYLGVEGAGYGVHLSVAGQDAIARARRMLAGMESSFDKALEEAVRKAASQLQSSSVKAIRERYDISATNIRASRNIAIRYQHRDGLTVYIHFSGRLIPLIRFGGASPKEPVKDTSRRIPAMVGENHWRLFYPSPPAHGHVLKGTSPALFEHAFTARMKTGHVGIYERTGGMTSFDRDEIEELFGPSVPEMLGNKDVAEKLSKEALDNLEAYLDSRVSEILNE